jgi:hypothetical protein
MSTLDQFMENQQVESTDNTAFDKEQWKQQKQQELESTMDLLNLSTSKIPESSGHFSRFLKTAANNPTISTSNILLLLQQREQDINQIASFKQWQAENRQVNKGETGLKILSSVTYAREDGSEGISYRVSRVFDIDQTRGPAGAQQDVMQHNLAKLLPAMAKGSPVQIVLDKNLESMNGFFDRNKMVIRMKSGLADEQAFSALLTEMAHAQLSSMTDGYDRLENSFKAKCTATIVAMHYGQNYYELGTGEFKDHAWPLENTDIRSWLSDVRQAANTITRRIEQQLETAKDKAAPDKKQPQPQR